MYLLRPKSPSQHKSAFILALAAGLACYVPAASTEEAAAAETAASNARMLENILSKEGISLGGAFRSRYLHSSLGGPGTVRSLVPRNRSNILRWTSTSAPGPTRPPKAG